MDRQVMAPDLSEVDVLAWRGLETVAMATVGVSFGAIIAAPLCLLSARNIGMPRLLALPARGLLNALRGIDSFVFALIFVAAVGLGPFAGVLGVALHTAGSIAKLWAETIETTEPGPVEAARMSGAGRRRVFLHAQLPCATPTVVDPALHVGVQCSGLDRAASSGPAESGRSSRTASTSSSSTAC